MRVKSRRDFGAGLVLLAIGSAFAIGATEYTFGSSARPGPGYFPLLLGVILALLGGVVLFASLTVETADGEPIGPIAWKPLLLVVGSVVIFGLLLPRLGMVLTLPILVATASLAGEEFRWKDVVISSLVLTGGCWVVFIKGLNLTIPLWPTILQAVNRAS